MSTLIFLKKRLDFKKSFRYTIFINLARVAKLVDALDLGSSGATRESSSLSSRTILKISNHRYLKYLSVLKFKPTMFLIFLY